MRALGIGVGSRVELTGRKTERGAEPAARVYTVTGTGLVPQGPHNSYSDGGWVTPEGFDALFEGFTYHFVLAELRDGVVPDRVTGPLARRINERLGAPAGEGFTLDVPASPVELLELRQVRALPLVLGLFLALLAVGAIGHVLATAVRRRASDIAVLRALGMTRTQSRWVTVSQASVLALAGLLIGLPTGLALGRVVWRAVADYLPLQYVAPSAGLAMLLAVPAALLVVNVLAALPSRRAARLRIADVLRAE
jgi:hypothetical protein